jgi:hypothetical protein
LILKAVANPSQPSQFIYGDNAMIRKLRVGEVIREGDFLTQYDTPESDRLIIPSDSLGDKVNQDDCDYSPIFREIPDNNTIIDHDGEMYPIDAKYYTLNFTSESIKARAQWLLEVAEFIEEGEQL